MSGGALLAEQGQDPTLASQDGQGDSPLLTGVGV
jgi:hypothetical protein